MIVNELYKLLDQWYPFSEQEVWDKSGAILSFDYDVVFGVMIGLDVTLGLVLDAIKNKCNVILTHHPIYIDEQDAKKKDIKNIINLLKENKISLISLHTNFDKNRYGMNYHLLKKIGLVGIKRSKNSSFLFYGDLKSKFNFQQFIKIITKKLTPDYIIFDYNNDRIKENKKINRVAIIGGSGSSDYEKILKKEKIDLFITGEVKWHVWNMSSKSIPIIDIGHSIEKIFIDVMYKKIQSLGILACVHSMEIKLSKHY